MTREEQLQILQFRAEGLLRQHKASRELHCKMEGNRASEMSAEYLMRHVPEEPLPRFLSKPQVQDGPEYVNPLRFIAGWVVVVAIAALIWGLA